MRRSLLLVFAVTLLLAAIWFFFLKEKSSPTAPRAEEQVLSTEKPELEDRVQQPVEKTLAINTLRLYGRTFRMQVLEPCGRIDDQYSGTTAVSVDSNGEVISSAPQIMVQMEGGVSLATLSLSEDQPLIRVYKTSDDPFDFDGSTVSYSGFVGGPDTEPIAFSLKCP